MFFFFFQEQLASIEGLGDGQTPRGKRTIGPYREIFPELTRVRKRNVLSYTNYLLHVGFLGH